MRKLRGFTLVELLVGMSLGVVVLTAAVAMFSKALDATYLVSQRAEMQQNARSAMEMISRDISLAGYGVPTGGVQLPTGGGGNSLYGCDAARCYVGTGNPPTGMSYPTVPASGTSPAVTNHLYGIIPGPAQGIATGAGGTPSDIITLVYADSAFRLDCYNVTAFGNNATSITLALPSPLTPDCQNPAPQQVNAPVVGLQAGDLVLLTNANGAAVAEVTSVPNATTVNFADNDPLKVNQSNATAGNLKTFQQGLPTGTGATPTKAVRLFVIPYYVDVPPGADSIRYTADDQPPRLMRQVNGLPPVPVAENIADLQFTYDVYNDISGTAQSGLKDGGLSQTPPVSPNQIRKVNVVNLGGRSPLQGAELSGRGFQSISLATAVSARNMSFRDRYQ